LQNRLNAQGVRLPIVFVTGHGDIPTSVEAIKAGAEDFLTKPVFKDALSQLSRAPSIGTSRSGSRIIDLLRCEHAFPN
jgi:FixJ family two-component response regulator